MKKKIWFQKHMAQHILSETDLNWINKVENCILIRNPKEVILSYQKKYKINSIEQLGYPQLTKIYNLLCNINQCNPIIIDAKDILINPKKILKLLCNKLSIPFLNEMLKWPSGPRETDGVWGEHWYNNVISTTTFQPYVSNENPIPIKYKSLFDSCMEHYQQY